MFDDFTAEAYPDQGNNDYCVNHVVQRPFSSNPSTINSLKREHNGHVEQMAQWNNEDDDSSIWILDSDDEMPSVCDNYQRDEQPSTSKCVRTVGSKINNLISGRVQKQSNTESAVNAITKRCGVKKLEKCPASVQRSKLRPRNVRSFKCEVCFETFRINQKLILHRRLHLDSSSIHCRICLSQFSRMDEKKDHEKCCNLLRYECYLCRCLKLDKRSLIKHMLKHSNKKEFQCLKCRMKFKHNRSLHYHRKFACHAKK